MAGVIAAVACIAWLALGRSEKLSSATPDLRPQTSSPLDEGGTKANAYSSGTEGTKRVVVRDDSDVRGGAATSHIDVAIDRYSAADLCDDPRIEKGASVRDLIAYAKKTGNDAKVANTQAQLMALCDPSNGLLSLPLVQMKDRETFIAENSELVQDVIAFSSLAVEVDSDGKRAVGDDEVVRFVRQHLSKPASLHEFLEVVRVLGDAGLLKVALRDTGYPQGIQRDVEAAAAILAGCEVFGGCQANSVFSIGLCFLNCTRPMSAEEYAVSSISARDVNTAQLAAAALVNARRGS